ncbi:MAG: tetratricopeptide repeat protein [Bacteroidia bacterium]
MKNPSLLSPKGRRIFIILILSPLFWRGVGGEVFAQGIEEYYQSGLVKYNAKDYKGGMADFTKAIELNSSPDAGTYYLRGTCWFELGKYQEALSDFSKTIELSPNDHWAYYMRGTCRYFLKHYQLAFEDYNQALELNPTDAGTYFFRADTKQKLGDIAGACLDWKKADDLGRAFAKYALQ